MSRRPFLIRLIIPFAVMIAVVIAVCGGVIYWSGQRSLMAQQIQDLHRLVMLVRGNVSREASVITPEQSTRIKDLAVVLNTRITLIDGQGVVMLDTHYEPALMDNHNNREEVIKARARGTGSSARRSETIKQDAVYVAELLDPGKPQGVVVRLSYPEQVWATLGVPVWAIVLAGTASATLVLLWLAIVLQRRWVAPVRQLAAASDQMAAGNWQTRVDPAGDDEVRMLGNRFNVMAAQAQKQLSDLSHQRADLQALVDALPDPIILSDALERIVVINAPAARLLHLTPPRAQGRKIVEVVNEEAILGVIEQLKSEAAPITREIRLQRNGQHVTYQAVATPANAGGVLIALRNVSAMAATVQMKTDFVANASHELRTPLAAIKVAFETLRDVYQEDPQQSARCISIIDGHLGRLEEMLSDLLDLSRVESPHLRAQIAPVQTSELADYVKSTMAGLARAKEVELEFSANGAASEQPFNSDRRLLDLILKNLVENSIKFTPAGGKVTVLIDADQAAAISLRVIDTGIGIPPEHQQRVFERFYQVDPARRGASGRGTGLGLAIVKHAVHALGGTVELESVIGKGTTVTCRFPDLAMVDQPILPENENGRQTS